MFFLQVPSSSLKALTWCGEHQPTPSDIYWRVTPVHDKLLSRFAHKFNLRCYNKVFNRGAVLVADQSYPRSGNLSATLVGTD
jgi:hypothetical protein